MLTLRTLLIIDLPFLHLLANSFSNPVYLYSFIVVLMHSLIALNTVAGFFFILYVHGSHILKLDENYALATVKFLFCYFKR